MCDFMLLHYVCIVAYVALTRCGGVTSGMSAYHISDLVMEKYYIISTIANL